MALNLSDALMQARRRAQLQGRPLSSAEMSGVTSGWADSASARLARARQLGIQEKGVALDEQRIAETKRANQASEAQAKRALDEQIKAANKAAALGLTRDIGTGGLTYYGYNKMFPGTKPAGIEQDAQWIRDQFVLPENTPTIDAMQQGSLATENPANFNAIVNPMYASPEVPQASFGANELMTWEPLMGGDDVASGMGTLAGGGGATASGFAPGAAPMGYGAMDAGAGAAGAGAASTAAPSLMGAAGYLGPFAAADMLMWQYNKPIKDALVGGGRTFYDENPQTLVDWYEGRGAWNDYYKGSPQLYSHLTERGIRVNEPDWNVWNKDTWRKRDEEMAWADIIPGAA